MNPAAQKELCSRICSVRTLMLFTLFIRLLSVFVGIVLLDRRCLLRGRNLTVPPQRIRLIFHHELHYLHSQRIRKPCRQHFSAAVNCTAETVFPES